MKIARQFAGFAVSVAVGVCLYSLLKLRPIFQAGISNLFPPVGENHPGRSPHSALARRPLVAHVTVPEWAGRRKHLRLPVPRSVARHEHVTPKVPSVTTVGLVKTTESMPFEAVSARRTQTVFKPIGYVEKAGGQREAIILHEDEIQIVHLGDLIGGRYRVTEVSPDAVATLDESLGQTPRARPDGLESNRLSAGVAPLRPLTPGPGPVVQPEVPAAGVQVPEVAGVQGSQPLSQAPAVAAAVPPAVPALAGSVEKLQPDEPAGNTLGYVQQADGKIETVVADADSVRLVPDTTAVSTAQLTPPDGSLNPNPPAWPSAAPVAEASPVISAKSERQPIANQEVEASAIRPVAYQIPATAPDDGGRATRAQLGAGSLGDVAGITHAASGPANSISSDKPSAPDGSPAKIQIQMKPLGYVVKADGEFAAILSQNDDVYVVQKGDHFAGHYRALSVSADAVEAVEEPPSQAFPAPFTPSAAPDLLSAQAMSAPPPRVNASCAECKSVGLGKDFTKAPKGPSAEVATPPPREKKGDGELAEMAKRPARASRPIVKNTVSASDTATIVFQTLGYVQTQGGEVQAVVANGSELFLVKQGETFADQYKAISVDPTLVLAVKAPAGQEEMTSVLAQAEISGKSASNRLYGYRQFPLPGRTDARAFQELDSSGVPAPTDLGVNLLPLSLAALGVQGQFLGADRPNLGL